MKLLLNVSIWSDSKILPNRVIEFNSQEELSKHISILLSDLRENLENLPSNRVGYQIMSNVKYSFTAPHHSKL